MVERRPIALFASAVPVETTRSLGAPGGGLASHVLRSSSIRWQKPQPGFQKRTRILLPRKSDRLTVLPLRLGRPKEGAASPTLRLADWPWALAALPLVGAGSDSLRARARTAGAPAASSEAILPCASTRTAIGVPLAPNVGPTAKFLSSSTGERNSIAAFSSTAPVVTTRSFGDPLGGLASQAFRSSSICWQKPQPGFQNSTRILLPRKSERFTSLPLRLGRAKAGAASPTFGVVDGRGVAVAAPPLPLPLLLLLAGTSMGKALPLVGEDDGTERRAGRPTAWATRTRMASAPMARGLPIIPSERTSPALGVPLAL